MQNQEKKFVGLGLMTLSTLLFSLVNVSVKDVTATYPIPMVVFFRFFFALLPCLFLVRGDLRFFIRHPKRFPLILLTALGTFLGLWALFLALHLLPLADATALTFSSTFFVTILSVPILKEHVGIHRWLAVALGFGGVLIMANPTGNIFQIGALFAIGFALASALMQITARLLTKTSKSGEIVFYISYYATLMSLVALPFAWVTPTTGDLMKLILMGIGGGIGQLFLTHAHRFAPAVVISPVFYTMLIWSSLFGYFIWDERPASTIWLGSGIIILAGLYIIYREKVHMKKGVPA